MSRTMLSQRRLALPWLTGQVKARQTQGLPKWVIPFHVILETFYETFKFYYLIFYLQMICLCICLFTTCVLGAEEGTGSLEVEEHMARSHDVGADNQTPVPLKE